MPHRVLAFMAHPDDAEIFCGGTLIRLREGGAEVHIATATAGDCGTMTESPWKISAIRTEEAKAAAEMIGATYHCLGEQDCLVVFDKPTLRKCYELFREIAPTLVFTQARSDYMMDHEIVSQLARAASFIYGAPNISTRPRRHDSKVPYLYYCDPLDGIDPLGKEVSPTTVIDVTDVHARKLEMLSKHASQREWLRAHHGMDEYLDATRRHDFKRGKFMDVTAAEAFVQHRGHAYPNDDILAKMLGGLEIKSN